MKKIYITRYSNLVLELERGGLKAQVEFKRGRMNDNVPGRFITSDPLLQYMIEKDGRYGSLFRLEKSIPTTEELKAKQAAEAKDAKPKQAKPATIVDSVRDCADAIDYFASIGKALNTEKQVKATMKAMNIQFPNWEQ